MDWRLYPLCWLLPSLLPALHDVSSVPSPDPSIGPEGVGDAKNVDHLLCVAAGSDWGYPEGEAMWDPNQQCCRSRVIQGLWTHISLQPALGAEHKVQDLMFVWLGLVLL